jgi:hypothetical protein
MKRKELANGNYALVFYYNDNNDRVDERDATKCKICEFDSNDNLITEASFEYFSNTIFR